MTGRERFNLVRKKAENDLGAVIFGICNVTPDSFSDGGLFVEQAAAFRQIDALIEGGAHVIDVGGESTRPFAAAVPADEQLDRVLPAIRYASERALVSIDTRHAEVAERCLKEGASVVNDVSCLGHPDMAAVVAQHDAAIVIMHSRGTPETMGKLNHYDDLITDVVRELEHACLRAEGAGVSRDAIAVDPGFGFAKSKEQSLALLADLRRFVGEVRRPVLAGASRKSFLAPFAGEALPEERLGASVAAALYATMNGATMVRVHDVAPTSQALHLFRHLRRSIGRQTEPRVRDEKTETSVA